MSIALRRGKPFYAGIIEYRYLVITTELHEATAGNVFYANTLRRRTGWPQLDRGDRPGPEVFHSQCATVTLDETSRLATCVQAVASS